MKKKIRLLTAILLVFITTFGMNIEASAAGITLYNSQLKRLALLNNAYTYDNEIYCSGINAMGISSDNNNCLYTIKIDSDNEAAAIMYYFPNISDWTTYKKFDLYGVGHANGMTVDEDYIYICASRTKNVTNPNNKIVRISRNYISSLYNAEEPILTASTTNENCKIMQPKKVNPNVSDRATTPYVNYTEKFSTISMDKSSGTFIIGKVFDNVDSLEYNGFTRARIIDNEFVVSTDINDMFLVKNNIVYQNAARQDICYASGYGLFIGKWYRKPAYDPDDDITDEEDDNRDPTKNVILWANIDKKATESHKGYKLYIPDRILIDVGDYVSKEYNVKMYTFFEIESLGITNKGNLVANFNINYTEEYRTAYRNENGVNPSRGGIYKITREDGSQYKL